jgi:electron transfer flavoprotein beta subunit
MPESAFSISPNRSVLHVNSEGMLSLILRKRLLEKIMILIPIKQVPDSWSEKELDPATKRLARAKADPVLNDLDEFAIEAALQVAEGAGLATAVVTVGPDSAREALLKGLSMGVDEAYHVNDQNLVGACYMQTSAAIAAVAKKVGATAIFAGLESTDGKGAVIPSMIAAHLKWPSASSVTEVSISVGAVKAKLNESHQEVNFEIPMPCVISLAENSNEPRFPSFKGIMAAKKKTITNLALSDLMDQGLGEFISNPTVSVLDWQEAAPRSKGALITEIDVAINNLAGVLREVKESK